MAAVKAVSDEADPKTGAEQAGFFATSGNRGRMVMPLGASSEVRTQVPPTDEKGRQNGTHGGGGGGGHNGGGGNGDGTGVDPAILGLLRRLPLGGTPITSRTRTDLIAAFTAVVTFIYPDADESERPQTEA